MKIFFIILIIYSIHNIRSKEFAIIGYIPEYRQNTIDWKAISPHLTHAILFSLELTKTGELAALDRFPNEEFMNSAKKNFQNKGGKLLICFGGNSRTNGFPEMVKEKENRRNFINNLQKLMEEKHLDGVDLNWEYPRDHDEWIGLFKLIIEIRENFGNNKIITLALYPGQEKIFPDYIINIVDYFLVMIYDMSCKNPPCHHSSYNFFKTASLDNKNIKKCKIALGLPFYARDGFTFKAETYAKIVKFGIDDKKDEIKGEGRDFWMFNSVKTISDKTKFSLDNHFGGVMIWEVGQDLHPSNKLALLPAITQTINKYKENNEL